MYLSIKFKFKFLHRAFKNREFRLLDVGSANNSAQAVKKTFPNCKYYGLDLTKRGYTTEGFSKMEAFYELDLTQLNYSQIPDDYFDYIQMAHVIEHLPNGEEVLKGLLKKLKKDGYFYVEFPGARSTRLPSMPGTLNFYDDKTHVRVYSYKEVANIFTDNNCEVLRKGTRRSIIRIILMPAIAAASLVQHKKIMGMVFWDLLGFAEYVWVKKK